VLGDENRKKKFLAVCKTFLRKDYASGEDKLTLWYGNNLSAWPVDHVDRFIDELHVSIRNTPPGEQRRAAGKADDALTKLLNFLSPLERKHRPR
jgi:hypothetical protein